MEKHDSIPELERRYVELTLRAEGDEAKPVIEGDAAVFGVETVIGKWFREKIRAGAFSRVLSEKPDVIGAFNHDWSYVLGRTTAGTLKLEQTEKSLRYAIDVNPNDPQAMSVWEKVKRGDVSQSSFAFTVRKEEWTVNADDSDEKLALREVVEVGKLFDVGPVPFAQYPEASAQARSKSKTFQKEPPIQAASDDAEEVQARHRARRRQVDLMESSVYGNNIPDAKHETRNNAKAEQWLEIAIRRHERHMTGTEPTTGESGEISQRLMMEEMQYALLELTDKFVATTDWYDENITKFPDQPSSM